MLRVVAAAIAVGALMVCAGPAVAEGLGDNVVTFANAPNDGATFADGLGESDTAATDGLNDTTSADAPNNGAATSADGLGESGTMPADGRNDSISPFADPPTSADGLSESGTTSADGLNDLPATSVEEGTDNAATSAEDTDDAVTPAAGQYDTGATPAGLTLSLIRLGTRALALTVVPLHQFPAFDAVITHESGWDVFAINPESGAYGLGQALPAEKMQTHGADWRFNPLTQIRWTYDYMNARYGSPDGAWAFWQQHHWY
ncbi:transglycosylase SLT domain-containing protein [Nocardia anaemiae]|uniref:aggregation-promoting factor C-terminal-like domain-containing protein n=1 Tax=Nocardia anaemiae TaxID=263910 RepID=UPI000AFDD0A1|nr:transglycosylase SLT domain-containing protein [Nocardia anaemiae]